MIRGVHALFYSSEPEATRAFLRDKLRLPYTDTGGGWLIFDLPEGDLGVHPIGETGGPPSGTHDISLYCDDINGTVADLRSRGVQFEEEVSDAGFGLVTTFTMPGGVKILLYEPKYTKRISTGSPRRAKPRGPGEGWQESQETAKIALRPAPTHPSAPPPFSAGARYRRRADARRTRSAAPSVTSCSASSVSGTNRAFAASVPGTGSPSTYSQRTSIRT